VKCSNTRNHPASQRWSRSAVSFREIAQNTATSIANAARFGSVEKFMAQKWLCYPEYDSIFVGLLIKNGGEWQKIGGNLARISGFYLFYATEVVGWVGQDKYEAGGPPASEGFSAIGSYKLRPL